MTSRESVAANLGVIRDFAQRSRLQGASLLCLPECFDYMGRDKAESMSLAEPLTGPIVSECREIARSNGLWLSLGGMHEATGNPSGKIHNTHLVIDAEGGIVAMYRKIHLFDIVMAGGPVLKESDGTEPGDVCVACDSPVGRLGLSTCFDLRFPEMYGHLVRNGAEVLLVPSAFTATTGKAHWHALLRARAIENFSYVVAAAQVGRHNDKRESYGHACIIDPWGNVLADMGGESTGIMCAEINLDYLHQVRARIPSETARRPEVYAKPVLLSKS
jgi:predicted amidohydrolase